MVSSTRILSIGLDDLAPARNHALRTAGFEVVSATSLDEIVQQCRAFSFDVAIVGHAFSILEKAQMVRVIQAVFWLPVVLITDGQSLASIPAGSHIEVHAPLGELLDAVTRLAQGKKLRFAAS